MRMTMLLLAAMVFFLSPLTAHAYVGPGLGLGAIGAILGVLLSIVLAIFGIFWYPIKRVWKKLRRSDEKKDTKDSDN